MCSRRGSVFLFGLMVMGALFALAYGILSSSRLALTSAYETAPQTLADQAAQEGLVHAIGTIHKSFQSTGTYTTAEDGGGYSLGVPSQFTDGWRQEFWPLNTHREPGRARGLEMVGEDIDQDDVGVDSFLNEYYAGHNAYHPAYENRAGLYSEGWTTHPGIGRWYEVGVRSANPVLSRTTAPTSLPAAFDESFDASGAPLWTAAGSDVFEPMRYNTLMQPTDINNQVRYRLRYAVAVEPLDGHLGISIPSKHGDVEDSDEFYSAAPVSVGTWRQDEGRGFDVLLEIRNSDSEKIVYQMAEMLAMTAGPWGQTDDINLAMIGAGYGNNLLSDQDQARFTVMRMDNGTDIEVAAVRDASDTGADDSVAGADAGLLTSDTYSDLHTVAYITGTTRTIQVTHENLGPITSHGSIGLRYFPQPGTGQADRMLIRDPGPRQYLFQPFAAAPNPDSKEDDHWMYGNHSTVWRVNVPVMAPKAWATMLQAYLPWEAKHMEEDVTVGGGPQQLKARQRFRYVSHAGSVGGSSGWFDAVGGFGTTDDEFPPYPGTFVGDDTGATVWDGTEGATIQVAELSFANGNIDPADPTARDSRIYHLYSDDNYTADLYDDNYQSPPQRKLSDPNDLQRSYVNEDSYYLDIAAAFRATMAVTGYVWMDHVNPDGDNYDPVDSGGISTRDVTTGVPTMLNSVIALDQQFLKNIGEITNGGAQEFTYLSTPTRSDKPQIVTTAFTSDTISDIGGDRAELMELVLNDFRMSFFGASPQYVDSSGDYSFRPLDFSGDGIARCSCYNSGEDIAPVAGASVHFPGFSAGAIPDQNHRQHHERRGGDRIFTVTGYFVFQKSRYYRIFVRGELFDEVRQVSVAQANTETVYVVDPGGDQYNMFNLPNAGNSQNDDADDYQTGMLDSHMLFHRKWDNIYRGALSQTAP